jgi:hypothetical protein
MPKEKDDEIVHPLFERCSDFTDDKFWKKTFSDLAKCKTPNGVYIYKGSLRLKGKPVDSITFAETDDCFQTFHNIYKFLSTTCGILSPDDKIKQRHDFESIEQENKNNWVDIKRKKVKDLMIESFAVKMKQIYLLSLKQTRCLISSICMGLLFKSISASNIILENGSIKNIDGISFRERRIFFDLELYNTDIEEEGDTSVRGELQRKYMIEYWVKYLSDLSSKPEYKIDFCQ